MRETNGVLKPSLICNNNGRSISDTGDDFPLSIAHSSRVTHPRSCGDYEVWIAVIVIGAENSMEITMRLGEHK